MFDINTTPDEFARACRKNGFMVLPFEPNDADLNAIAKSFPIAGGRKWHAEKAYASLVSRRREEADVISGDGKAPRIDL